VRPLLRALLSSWLVVVCLAALSRDARAETAIDLYTVGPGSYLYSAYGHSILCARDASAKPAEGKGKCYDYGVADKPDELYAFWGSVRGRAIFVPISLDDRALVAFFTDQGRAMERQVLPLSADEASALAASLEHDVTSRFAYAYHPYTANCASLLRDRIDEATHGRLRPGLSQPGAATFRQRMEVGLSGRAFELAALSFILGPMSERAPNGWEAMFTPEGLRDGVAERLGVKAEPLAERQAYILPTSVTAGRLLIFLVAGALFAGVRFGARKNRLGVAIKVVGIVLGLLALLVDATALLSTWPELSRNWCLVVLLPTDLALGFMSPRWLVPYLKARLGMVVALAALEVVSVVGQPVLPQVVLVALPLAAIFFALRATAKAPSPKAEPSAA